MPRSWIFRVQSPVQIRSRRRAETALLMGEALPLPNYKQTDPEADIEEPIHLLLGAASVIPPSSVGFKAVAP
jgi:hypothetical protein